MAYQSLMDLMNADAMKQAQLYNVGQESQLRRLQMEQAMQEQAKRSKLQELMTQAAQGAVTQPQALPDTLGVSSYRPEVADQIWGAGAAPEQAATTQQAWDERANIPTTSPGGFDPGKFSDLLIQSGDPEAVMKGMELKKSMAGEGFTLGEGQVRYGASGQEVARGPAKAPKEVSRWSDPYSMGGATVQRNIDTGEIRTAVSRPPVTNVNVGTPKETFKNERDLRNDFQGLPTTKAFREVQTSFDQINYALNNPSAAGDLAAATKFMKLLDPGSVVRESELGMAMAATGKFDQLSNYYNMLKTGEKLTTSQRKDFKSLAKGLYDAAAGRYNETAAEYQNLAQQYDLNPERIAKTVKTVGTEKPRDVAPAKNFLNAATTQDDLAKRVKSLKNKGWTDEEIKQAYGD